MQHSLDQPDRAFSFTPPGICTKATQLKCHRPNPGWSGAYVKERGGWHTKRQRTSNLGIH